MAIQAENTEPCGTCGIVLHETSYLELPKFENLCLWPEKKQKCNKQKIFTALTMKIIRTLKSVENQKQSFVTKTKPVLI